MGKQYEVQFANQLEGADQYGNVTFSVKFTTEDKSALWRVSPKTTVEPGTQVFGHIEEKIGKSGKPYLIFKREQQEGGNFSAPQQVSRQSSTGRTGFTKGSDDRNDGMRQGMSINNAVALLRAYISTGTYTATDPAEVVKDLEEYARLIYKIDLAKSPAETVFNVSEEDIQTVDNGQILDELKDLGM